MAGHGRGARPMAALARARRARRPTSLRAARRRLTTAESCTGGWVAKCLTDIAGSSQWFERGYVTYSNRGQGAERSGSPPSVHRDLRRGQPADRRADGGRRAACQRRRCGGRDHRHRRTGRRQRRTSPSAWCGSRWRCAARRRRGRSERRSIASRGDREAIRRAAVAAALELLRGSR